MMVFATGYITKTAMLLAVACLLLTSHASAKYKYRFGRKRPFGYMRMVCTYRTTISYASVFPKSATLKLPIVFYFPCRISYRRRPLTIIMNGGVVLSSEYETISRQISRAGYVIAIADLVRPGLPGVPPEFVEVAKRDPGCSNGPVLTSAKVIPTILSWLKRHPFSPPGHRVNLSRLFLLAHSYGGVVSSFATTSGLCTNSPEGRFLCDGFDTADRIDLLARLKGVALYEAVNHTRVSVPLPPSTPALFLYANAKLSIGAFGVQAPPAALINFQNTNHFGLNDWVPKNAPRQFGRCHPRPNRSDIGFKTTRLRHERALRAIGKVIILGFKKFATQNRNSRRIFTGIVKRFRGTRNVQVKVG